MNVWPGTRTEFGTITVGKFGMRGKALIGNALGSTGVGTKVKVPGPATMGGCAIPTRRPIFCAWPRPGKTARIKAATGAAKTGNLFIWGLHCSGRRNDPRYSYLILP